MAEHGVQCPKCGAEAAYRLGEYECTQCGYFFRAAEAKPAGRISARLAAAQGLDALPAQRGHRSVALLDDPGRASRRWLAIKRIYLLVLFVGLTLGTLAKAQLTPDFTVTARFIWMVGFASLLATGLAALLLFIDWRTFRIVGQVALVGILGACGYEFYLWDGKDQLRLVLIAFNALLVLALAVLNQFDIMRMK